MSGESLLLALRLEGRRCLVVGNSEEAALRARNLRRAGALVRVVAEAPCAELRNIGGVELEERPFQPTDLDGVWLVVLADRNPNLLERLGPVCDAHQILFCAVDQPGFNSFHHVAIARAGTVSVAISTEGRAPALGRRLREELQRTFDEAQLSHLADRIADLRERTPPERRRAVLGEAVRRVRLEGGWRWSDGEEDL